jgi:hypothetical protein
LQAAVKLPILTTGHFVTDLDKVSLIIWGASISYSAKKGVASCGFGYIFTANFRPATYKFENMVKRINAVTL